MGNLTHEESSKFFSRRKFMGIAMIGFAGVVGLTAFARQRLSGRPKTIWGLSPGSLFMPRSKDLDRYLKNR